MYHLVVEKYFSSAHRLREYRGKCENLHGHNYRVLCTLEGENLNETGLLVDFKEVKGILSEVLEELDHKYLNDHPFFEQVNPSAENIARFIYQEVSKSLPPDVRATKVWVWESEGCGACYRDK